jgi:hypothetical protein
MMSNETPMIKQRYFDGHLPRLKPIDEHRIVDKQPVQTQPKLRTSSLFPPISQNTTSKSTMTNNIPESPITYTPAVREAAQRFLLRNNSSSLSSGSSPSYITSSISSKRTTLYDHIQSRIKTGLPRKESTIRKEMDIHRLEPTNSLNWHLLKQVLEQDTQIRAHTKRMQFNSGVTYRKQLITLGNLVRSKIKSHITSVMGYGEERYKIVVQLTVFPTTISGLHVASRCLWDTSTDNSITIKMQGVDCNILIVVFLCYTDLGVI